MSTFCTNFLFAKDIVPYLGEVEFYELAEKIIALPEVKNLIAKEVN